LSKRERRRIGNTNMRRLLLDTWAHQKTHKIALSDFCLKIPAAACFAIKPRPTSAIPEAQHA
jgi:hypothetical protein